MKIPEGKHVAMTIGIGRCITGWHARAYKVPVDFDHEKFDESDLEQGEPLAVGPHRGTEWEAHQDADRMAEICQQYINEEDCIVALGTVN